MESKNGILKIPDVYLYIDTPDMPAIESTQETDHNAETFGPRQESEKRKARLI